MRKVKVYKTNNHKDSESHEAIFHGFFQASGENGGYPVAVIESTNGVIEVVNADRIQFIKICRNDQTRK